MSTRSRLSKEAWSQYISEHNFELFVTTKYVKPVRTDPRIDANLSSIRKHEKYLAFVSSKCFGKKALTDSSKGLIYINFFEDMTKYGGPTVFHAHTLINTRGNIERVSHYLKAEWKKVRPFLRSTPPVIENITTIPNLGCYVAKHSYNEYEILANITLP